MSIGIVKTTYGLAKGISHDNGLTEFRGIPYAAPPIRNLRWKPPVKPEAWKGVRTFDTYAPIEVQYQDRQGDDAVNHFPMSEDCLYLNVTTPAKAAGENLPVLVWFHGGGLTNGTPYGDEVEPYSFAKRGNVVITVGHRINIWGFMALPQLTKEQGSSGNYGLMDLAAALEWIWDNIEAFGGDRNNITAGGESGGTQKTCIMATVPAGGHRIRRVYNSSGLKWKQLPFKTLEEGEKAGQEYLKYIGLDPNTPLEQLRAMDTYEIHHNVPREYYPGDIIYDGAFITEKSVGDLFDKYLKNVDFINVTAEGESNVFAHRGTSGVRGYFSGEVPVTDRASLYAFFKERLGDLYEKYDFEKLVQCADEDALYTAKKIGSIGISELASNNHSRNIMVNRLFGAYMKKHHPECRVYTLLWCHIPAAADRPGATDRDDRPEHRLADHCTDCQYIFNTLDKKDAQWTELDRRYADLMGAYVSNFTKCGDVNGEGLPHIDETGSNFAYAKMADTVEMHTGLESPLEELACEYVKKEYGITEDETA